MAYPLVRHPDFACDAVRGIDVSFARAGARLRLSYAVTGAIGELVLPSPAVPARTDELWKHTCFELFVRRADDEAYGEFNFSPSSEWAAYAFDSYRAGMRARDVEAPAIVVTRAAERLVMEVALVLPGSGDARLKAALSAVIEETNGRRSYWAMKHPAGKPDFHATDGFAADL